MVDLPATVEELVQLLTMAGVEVEDIVQRGADFPFVVVAEILESVQHPNADRLSVCQVNDGSGTNRQIVCGAKNYKVGDKVPLALPGAVLPGDFKIKTGKLRGVESQGMLCSAKELQLATDADGLLILAPAAQPGTAISELFPADTILEVEITPNRADLLSHAGVAREVAALTGSAVHISTPDCQLYTAQKIEGVKVGPSPEWLRTKLEAIGLRTINNVVDVTNFVMMEMGQPLHAFDAAKLQGQLQVRSARDGEEFKALDTKTYKLAPRHMVIADTQNAVAIAGVMGGEETGVTASTTDLWLESAHFVPQNVRRTGRDLGLSSDSSYRFERGVDAAGAARASARAIALITQLCGGTVNAAAALCTSQLTNSEAPAIALRLDRVTALLGFAVPPERIDAILTTLGLKKSDSGWVPPTFRPDLTREIDLIEEIARVVGMDAVPSRTQGLFAPSSPADGIYDRSMTLRRALAAQGLSEARSLTLVPSQPLGLNLTLTPPEALLRVKNPMIDDQVVLRPGLLHGLLSAIDTNVRHGADAIHLFEIGRVFSAQTPRESLHAALVLSGNASTRQWRGGEPREVDLYDLKGALASAFGQELRFEKIANPAAAVALAVKLGDVTVGHAGQLWPKDARDLDAKAPVFFAELDLSILWSTKTEAFPRARDIDRFPAVTRDMALLIPQTVAHGEIHALLDGADERLLRRTALFDVFTDPTGTKLPADQKSLAYSLTYQAADRTLAADEVNAAHARIKDRLKASLPLTFRE